MNHLILILIAVNFSFVSNANKTPELLPEIMLASSEKNDNLRTDEAVFIFQFNGFIDASVNRTIRYSIDGENEAQELGKQNELKIISTPGNHVFQFFYNAEYNEVTSDSLIILAQYVNTYNVRFQAVDYPVILKKPVIYLYPESETSFTVSVNPKGKMAFTYPAYNDSWKGIAYPNGDIKIGDETFNYLFWEADQTVTSDVIKSNQGSIVKGSETISFLNDQLNLFGLNSKEKADFITFWGPNLAKNKLNYIYFVLNEEANYFGELFISPKPDNIYRIYILTCPIEITDDLVDMEPQKIKPMNRNGFTIVEWGGSIIDSNMIKPKLNL